jgi:ABC-type amino acid transport substrate-binding protein
MGALSADAGDEKELLAPKGSLRVGVYPGSPTSMVTDPATRQTHGVAYDLGAEFAGRLQVPVEYVTFQRVADVVSAIKNGEVDFTVTNATPGAGKRRQLQSARNIGRARLSRLGQFPDQPRRRPGPAGRSHRGHQGQHVGAHPPRQVQERKDRSG